MPINPNRPQSGYFDSHGDGHPGRDAYMPAHSECEKTESDTPGLPVPAGEEVVE